MGKFLLDKNTVFFYPAFSHNFIFTDVLSFRISVACCLILSSNVPLDKSRRILFNNPVLFLRTGEDTTVEDFLGFTVFWNMRGWPPVLHLTASLSAECFIFRPVGCACMSPLLLSGVKWHLWEDATLCFSAVSWRCLVTHRLKWGPRKLVSLFGEWSTCTRKYRETLLFHQMSPKRSWSTWARKWSLLIHEHVL